MKFKERVKQELTKEQVKQGLTNKGLTIPELCKRFDVSDEFKMMRLIAELQHSDDVILNGFNKIYREDGGAIYLAKYSKSPPNEYLN